MSQFGFRSVRTGDRYTFDLVFSTNPRLVPIVRRFVNDFYKELFEDAELVSRLALATHELMENVVKYAAEPEGQLTIEVTPEASDPKAVIRVRNRASDEDVSRVGDLMAALAQSQDPFQFYLELMARTARRPDSGLGLARIRAEGEMSLSHTLTEGRLEITATASLAKET
jgi:two-component sensor histidine kinase